MFRKILYPLALLIVLTGMIVHLLPLYHAHLAELSFSDVPTSYPHYEAIQYVRDEKIVEGYADGSYRPDNKINRAEFTKIIIEAAFPGEASGADCFPDVKNEWFAKYVCFAKTKDVIGGYPDGSFQPAQNIAFVEAAKIITLAYGHDVDSFPVEQWFQPYAENLASRRAIPVLISAFDTEITRGHMAEMIHRLKAGITDRSSHTFKSLKGEEEPIHAPKEPVRDPVDEPKEDDTSDDTTPTDPVTHEGVSGNEVTITVEGDYRYIRSNGLPDHETGDFPNANNPNTISEQDYEYRVPKNPEIADEVTQNELSPFGVAINGIPFDPGAAEFWNNDRDSGWQYEALSGAINLGLDEHNAHVQPTGAYHYHGLPTALIANQSQYRHSKLIGYAADGFPIYALYGYTAPNDGSSPVKKMVSSYRVKSGSRSGGPGGDYDGTYVEDYEYVVGLGDLDECNGRLTVTPEYPNASYVYFITDSYPYIPRCFRGTKDPSFAPAGPGGPPGGPGGPPHPGGPGGPPPPR